MNLTLRVRQITCSLKSGITLSHMSYRACKCFVTAPVLQLVSESFTCWSEFYGYAPVCHVRYI
jgi:hypothetical protein